MFSVKPNLSFQVDIGSAKDVSGIDRIRSYERAGLFVPGIEIQLSTSDDKVVKEIWEGNKIKVLYGRNERLDLFGEYKILTYQIFRQTNYWAISLVGVHSGISFSVNGKSRFFENKSYEVLKSVLGESFLVKSEAKPTDDKMVWIQTKFMSNKAFALKVWQHSWYSGNNILLLGIKRDGTAVITDLETLSTKEDIRIGTLKGYKRFVGGYGWNAESHLPNYFTSSEVVDWDLKGFKYREEDYKYRAVLGINDPVSYLEGKNEIYRFFVDDNVHPNYNFAYAKNTEILSKLSSLMFSFMWEVCPECSSGELNEDRPPLELFQVVKLAVEETDKGQNPKDFSRAFLPVSGKYIIASLETVIAPGKPMFQSVYMFKDSFRV
jgi:hypothetical protein